MNNFDGQTWVAFSDLSGLKALYEEDRDKAAIALDKFYNSVYELQRETNSVNSIVVSDCAIFWIDEIDCTDKLEVLLDKMKRLHQQMLPDYLVRSTIAYGHFKYQDRLEMPRIHKNMIIGGAYLDAYANNDKINHGDIVIVKLPDGISYNNFQITGTLKELIRKDSPVKDFHEYFWQLQNKRQISSFMEKRKEIHYAIFREIKELYSRYINQK